MARDKDIIHDIRYFQRFPGKSTEESIEIHLQKHGILVFPPGIYPLFRTVNVPAGAVILGENAARTIIRPPVNEYAFRVLADTQFRDRIRSSGLGFQGRGGAFTFSGEKLYFGDNTRFHDISGCVFTNMTLPAIAGENLMSTFIHHNYFYLCDTAIKLSKQCLWVNISDNDIQGCGLIGEKRGTGILLQGTMPDGTPVTDFATYGASVTLEIDAPEGISITGNRGEGHNYMIQAHASRQVVIANNSMDVAYQRNIDVRGCEFVNIDKHYGLAHNEEAPTEVATIHISDSPKCYLTNSRIPYQKHGLELHRSMQATVTNNFFENFHEPDHGHINIIDSPDLFEQNNRYFT